MKDISEMWSKVANQPNNDSLRGTPPEDLVVFEHRRSDTVDAKCQGEGELLQILDRQGQAKPFSTRVKVSRGKRQGSYWQHALALFHVDEDGKQAVLEVVFGPLFARGFVYSVVKKNGRSVIVQERRWVS